jgi:microcystin-dependent protein
MEGYISEVRLFGGNFAPLNWAFCNGALLDIATYTALFALVGTTYGGNGQTTFGLPDLRGRIPVGTGQGPGLSNYVLGQASGTEQKTISTLNLPAHVHAFGGGVSMLVSGNDGSSTDPTGKYFANNSTLRFATTGGFSSAPLKQNLTLGVTGSSVPIQNRMPYSVINYIICLEGIFPSRN